MKRNRKHGTCPNCFPNGEKFAILKADRNEADNPVWICLDCQHQSTRKFWITKARKAKLARYEEILNEYNRKGN